ncbi:MAG: DUF4097 family beta strand repeat-containing protein [Candidatus Zixiibacteriota bacterium]
MHFCLKLIRSIGLIYTVFAMLSAATVFGGIEQEKEESFNVKAGGMLTIESDLGSIEITGVNGDKVHIRVLMEADTRDEKKAEEIFEDFHVEFEQTGDNVQVFGEYDNDRWNYWGNRRNLMRVKFLVTVPKEYEIDVETGGGGISISDLNGNVICKTSGGGLEFHGVVGEIQGRTSGGGIEIIRCNGHIDVETSGGGIDIEETEGKVYASTSGGGIDIDEIKGSIDASTSGGGITAYISGQPTDDCSLSTSGGGIKVYLDKNVNLDLDVQTSGGRIKSDFFEERSKKDNRYYQERRSSYRGSINDGGPELYLRTSAGNIYIEEI